MTRRFRSRSISQIALFFLLLLVYLMFPCKHCPEGFSAVSSKGLKLHQKKCPAYLNHEAAARSRRKATVESQRVKRTKLKERKVRSDLPVQGVSYLLGLYTLWLIIDLLSR